MLLKRFYHEGLAQASYMVGCQSTGEALIIDPNRNIEQYMEAAEQNGLRITGVTETHIHADFVSGARELAARTGAKLYLSDEGPADWKYTYAVEAGAFPLHDGDAIHVGRLHLDVLHTPGHTPEHLSFLLTDAAIADRPMGIFTGDFVFVGDVGRPDLLERAAGVQGTMIEGARQLFRSLSNFRDLADYIQIWPGHGAGSACGKALGAVPQSTVGYEKLYNWAFQIHDENEFVNAVLEGQPEPPRYFARMKRINKQGPAPRPTGGIKRQTVVGLKRRLEEGLTVVDVRSAGEYAAMHMPGIINIPFGSDFLTWAGWLMPYDRPLGLIVEDGQMLQVREELQLIGLDTVTDYWTPGTIMASSEGALPTGIYERRSANELSGKLAYSNMTLLDVRAPSEFAEGHLPGSRNVPLYQLEGRLAEINRDSTLLVYCAGGTRSPIAASILLGHGWRDVVEMYDGFNAWRARGCAIEK